MTPPEPPAPVGAEHPLDGLLAAIVTSSEAAIISVRLDTTVTSWNAAAERLYGYTAAEIVGRSLERILPPDRPDELRALLAHVASGGTRRLETVRVHRDGHVLEVALSLSPVRAPDGAVVGAAIIAQDIAAQKEAQHRRDEFVAMVSHELRTPMNGVLGMTDLLLATSLDHRQRQYAETVRFAAQSLRRVLDDILDLSTIDAGRLSLADEAFDVRATLHEVLALFAADAQRKALTLRQRVRATVPATVRGDPARLRQVLLNLVGNAVKFTERGEIVVRAALASAAADTVTLRFEVADTGGGLSEAANRHLFEPYARGATRSDPRYGSTGLGLAIARRLVEAMGGEIGIASRPGAGTTVAFTVRLGRHAAEAPTPATQPARPTAARRARRPTRAAAAAEAEAAASAAARPSILIVDDNPVNRLVARLMVEDLDCTVEEAPSGPAALAALARQPFAAILLDVQMPGMDGLETARRVRALPPPACHTPLIACTANAMRGDRERYLAAGLDDYLTKPHGAAALAAIIRRWVPALAEPASAPPADPPPPTHAPDPNPAPAPAHAPAHAPVTVPDAAPAHAPAHAPVAVPDAAPAPAPAHAPVAVPPGAAPVSVPVAVPPGAAAPVSVPVAVPGGAAVSVPVAVPGAAPVSVPVAVPGAAPAAPRQPAAAPEPRRATVLDPAPLAALRALQAPDEPDVIAELVTLFARQVPVHLAALRAALAHRDPLALRQAAHLLEGSAGTLGAFRVAQLCRQLGARARHGALDGAEPLLDRLERATTHALDALRASAPPIADAAAAPDAEAATSAPPTADAAAAPAAPDAANATSAPDAAAAANAATTPPDTAAPAPVPTANATRAPDAPYAAAALDAATPAPVPSVDAAAAPAARDGRS